MRLIGIIDDLFQIGNVPINKDPLGLLRSLLRTIRRHARIGSRGDHANVVGVRVARIGRGRLVGRVDMRDLLTHVEFATGRQKAKGPR
jgi:hypothetical protein